LQRVPVASTEDVLPSEPAPLGDLPAIERYYRRDFYTLTFQMPSCASAWDGGILYLMALNSVRPAWFLDFLD
jgi:hypothetical protein